MNTNLDEIFTYHAPKGDQTERYEEIRQAAKNLAEVICKCVPNGPDRSAAIRKIREASMTANAGIAIGEADWLIVSENQEPPADPEHGDNWVRSTYQRPGGQVLGCWDLLNSEGEPVRSQSDGSIFPPE